MKIYVEMLMNVNPYSPHYFSPYFSWLKISRFKVLINWKGTTSIIYIGRILLHTFRFSHFSLSQYPCRQKHVPHVSFILYFPDSHYHHLHRGRDTNTITWLRIPLLSDVEMTFFGRKIFPSHLIVNELCVTNWDD